MTRRASAGAKPASDAAAGAIRIREATIRDLPVVVELRLALLRENETHPVYGRLRPDVEARAEELFAAQLEHAGESIFLAERDREIIGILRCVESLGSPLLQPARYCYVSSVYVRPHARRSGVLRAMLARAMKWCRERGLDELRLHNVPTNDEASAAWDALGFEVVEHVRLRRLHGPSPARPSNGSSPRR